MKQTICSISAALLIAVGSLTQASAWQWAGGGKWENGVDIHHVWSDYFHASRCHGATAVGQWRDHKTAPKGVWAKASAKRKFWGGNKAYYDHC
ncbi:lactococcin 972 family bacteriocin [Kocuria sp. TGY1127_2]|uniref:lactococcin 972 family bacteriocin n=1 Tax=Kocuria sp. TGY1127_2 TaxID=2711328 RepID=UPI0015B97DA2|nr:lactococcin 972 family bacteriocin [Kocuria sp. TGY1127_2]